MVVAHSTASTGKKIDLSDRTFITDCYASNGAYARDEIKIDHKAYYKEKRQTYSDSACNTITSSLETEALTGANHGVNLTDGWLDAAGGADSAPNWFKDGSSIGENVAYTLLTLTIVTSNTHGVHAGDKQHVFFVVDDSDDSATRYVKIYRDAESGLKASTANPLWSPSVPSP